MYFIHETNMTASVLDASTPPPQIMTVIARRATSHDSKHIRVQEKKTNPEFSIGYTRFEYFSMKKRNCACALDSPHPSTPDTYHKQRVPRLSAFYFCIVREACRIFVVVHDTYIVKSHTHQYNYY